MAHDDEQTPSSKTPLSARLAAYGESLAKLRELQRQAEGLASRQLTVSQSTDNMNRSCNRQRSMEDRLVASSTKSKQPRRPHTSNGTSSNESELLVSSCLFDFQTFLKALSQLPLSAPKHRAPITTRHDLLQLWSLLTNLYPVFPQDRYICVLNLLNHLQSSSVE
ncbi:hypothetical protein CPB85DRAFT_711401 [Mucidula mucida]|nr:hypothetical protein CPB85DRAFT_711401 [Mucidula mucida]